jgi:hypothetical protein
MKGRYPRLLFVLAIVQAMYFLIAALWPLTNIESFMAVTGPKVDIWLVKTVGLLVTINAIILLLATLRNRLTMEVILLAILSAGAFSWVDIYYAWTDVISEIYLIDGAIEIFFVLCWFLLLLTKPSKKRRVRLEQMKEVMRE